MGTGSPEIDAILKKARAREKKKEKEKGFVIIVGCLGILPGSVPCHQKEQGNLRASLGSKEVNPWVGKRSLPMRHSVGCIIITRVQRIWVPEI